MTMAEVTCPCGREVVVFDSNIIREMKHGDTMDSSERCECGRRWVYGGGTPEMVPFVRKAALCLDLDGTVRKSRSGAMFGPTSPEDVEIMPNVLERIAAAKQRGMYVIGVSNQGVIGFGSKTELEVRDIIEATKYACDGLFDEVYSCPTLAPEQGGKVVPDNRRSLFRKPGIGMLAHAEHDAVLDGVIIDWDESLFVGDRPEDEACAMAAGIKFQWAWEFFGWPDIGSDPTLVSLEALERRLAEIATSRQAIERAIAAHPAKIALSFGDFVYLGGWAEKAISEVVSLAEAKGTMTVNRGKETLEWWGWTYKLRGDDRTYTVRHMSNGWSVEIDDITLNPTADNYEMKIDMVELQKSSGEGPKVGCAYVSALAHLEGMPTWATVGHMLRCLMGW